MNRTVVVVGSGQLARQARALLSDKGVPVDPVEVSAATDAADLSEAIDANAAAIRRSEFILVLSDIRAAQKRHLIAEICRRRDDAVVLVDESIATLAELAEGLAPDDVESIAISHLFVPLRHMKLAEVIAPSPEISRLAVAFCRDVLGRNPIELRDTPGFLANRLAFFATAYAVHEALRRNIPLDRADDAARSVTGASVGPFALYDLIGIDVMATLISDLIWRLPPTDPLRDVAPRDQMAIARLLDEGRVGRTTRAGFFRYGDLPGVYVPASDSYREGPHHAGPSDESEAADFIDSVKLETRLYALRLSVELQIPTQVIETAMRDGYGWTRSAFG